MYVRLKKLSRENANTLDKLLIGMLPAIVGTWVTDEPEDGGKAVVRFHPPHCQQQQVRLGIVRGSALYVQPQAVFLAPDGKAYIDAATYQELFA